MHLQKKHIIIKIASNGKWMIFFMVSLLSFSLDKITAQVGGNSTYDFLELPVSARTTALGGKLNALRDEDLSLAANNPSLLTPEMDNHLFLNYVDYIADINYGYASYSRNKKGIGSFAAGIQYINYGRFTGADENGLKTGNFYAAEYALNLIYSRPLGKDSSFYAGVNIKPLYSSLDNYSSLGIATDWGVTYHRNPYFTASVVFKNLGTQIKPYYNHYYEPLPFEIQAGISQKLEHAPFRFSFVFQHLEKPDMTYTATDSSSSESSGSGQKGVLNKLADKCMRHLIIGVEFTPFNNFFLRAGYNYQRRKEMQVEQRIGMVGFSWGIGLKISKFHIDYGHSAYHLGAVVNQFSVGMNLSEFYHKTSFIREEK